MQFWPVFLPNEGIVCQLLPSYVTLDCFSQLFGCSYYHAINTSDYMVSKVELLV